MGKHAMAIPCYTNLALTTGFQKMRLGASLERALQQDSFTHFGKVAAPGICFSAATGIHTCASHSPFAKTACQKTQKICDTSSSCVWRIVSSPSANPLTSLTTYNLSNSKMFNEPAVEYDPCIPPGHAYNMPRRYALQIQYIASFM